MELVKKSSLICVVILCQLIIDVAANPVKLDTSRTLIRNKRQIGATTDRYNDAKYAGQFAQMLQDLESKNKNVYVNFISSGFTGNEIPRELPEPMRSLSRFTGGHFGSHSESSPFFSRAKTTTNSSPIQNNLKRHHVAVPFRSASRLNRTPARSAQSSRSEGARSFRFPNDSPLNFFPRN